MNQKNTIEIVNSLISCACHDLNNYINIINLAQEIESTEILNNSLIGLSAYINILKTLSISDNINEKHIKSYIKAKKLNVSIFHYEEKLSGLMFFLLNKIDEKSKIRFYEDKIEIEGVNLNHKEIKELNGDFQKLEENNIILYLSYLKFKDFFELNNIEKENICIIKIKKL